MIYNTPHDQEQLIIYIKVFISTDVYINQTKEIKL